MGNSEVGHLTIGSGRVLFQDLMRVNTAIADGSFFENPALLGAFRRPERGGDVHLLGLVSHGGVHSHIDHLRALLELATARRCAPDVDPRLHRRPRRLAARARRSDLAELPADRIATVCGRYYAMDRDGRWERTERAFGAIVEARASSADDPVGAVQASYDARHHGRVHRARRWSSGRPRLEAGTDAALFFNFRPDRARQLSRAPARGRRSTSRR